MPTPLPIGIIGCASIARRRMLPALSAHPAFALAAVAARDTLRATALAAEYDCRAHADYGSLLDDDTIRAVYVPLPVALHAHWVEAALLAGKHVLAEKPLTTEPSETRRLFALADSRGLTLMENVMFVHHAQHRAVRRVVALGAIGEPRAFEARFSYPRPPDGDIRYDPALGGGSLYDVGIYPLRAAVHILGPALDIVGAALFDAGRPVDVSGAVLLRSPDGVLAQLSFGMDDHYRSAYAVSGTLGRIVVERAFMPSADHRPSVFLECGGDRRALTLPADDQAARTLSAFAAAVEGADTTGRAGCLAQADLLAAVRSAAIAGPAPAGTTSR